MVSFCGRRSRVTPGRSDVAAAKSHSKAGCDCYPSANTDHENPVIPVSRVIPDALADVLRRAPLTPEKVAFSWRTAVGSVVDKVTTVELYDGVLYVRARDAAWQREIERSAALIRSRLDSLLGERVVRRIEVVRL